MTDDVWTVHHGYRVEMLYPDNVQVILDDKFENGLHFEGDEGWIFCTRSAVKVTASDSDVKGDAKGALRASKPSLLAPLGADAKRLPGSKSHKLNWIESIIGNRDPIAPVEDAARSVSSCCVAWIGMKLGRKLNWDVATESFVGDDEANALRSRTPRRVEFDIQALLKKAGI